MLAECVMLADLFFNGSLGVAQFIGVGRNPGPWAKLACMASTRPDPMRCVTHDGSFVWMLYSGIIRMGLVL